MRSYEMTSRDRRIRPSEAARRSAPYTARDAASVPVRRRRSVPAFAAWIARTLVLDAPHARGGVERVGDGHAPEAELAAQERRPDRARPAGRVPPVVRGVDGVREHHDGQALLDGSAVRVEARRERRPRCRDPHAARVRVPRREAEAREVLHRRERAAAAEPDPEGVREPARRRGRERPGPPLPVDERRRRGRDVRDRREVGVDSEPAQGFAGAPALPPGDGRRADPAHLRRRARRRDPRDRLHRAAFLVDRDEQPRPAALRRRAAKRPRDRPQARGRVEVRAVDEDAADAAGADAPQRTTPTGSSRPSRRRASGRRAARWSASRRSRHPPRRPSRPRAPARRRDACESG